MRALTALDITTQSLLMDKDTMDLCPGVPSSLEDESFGSPCVVTCLVKHLILVCIVTCILSRVMEAL